MRSTQGLSNELYTTALVLASELEALVAETPASWWVRNPKQAEPDDIVHFMHQVLLMRVYLPFAFHEEPMGEDYSSRMACMAACEGVAQRYQFLRRTLPSGFLLAQTLDLQAFTATVVLLLMTHDPLPLDPFGLNGDKARIEGEVAQVVKLMSEKAHDITRSHFARNGVATICSLRRLLQQDGIIAQNLTLKVPLLGKVHIRRNVGGAKLPLENATLDSIPTRSDPSIWTSSIQSAPQQPYSTQMGASVLQTQQDWPSNHFSWSVDNNLDYFFQDALMPEDFDQFDAWQDIDMNLPLYN